MPNRSTYHTGNFWCSSESNKNQIKEGSFDETKVGNLLSPRDVSGKGDSIKTSHNDCMLVSNRRFLAAPSVFSSIGYSAFLEFSWLLLVVWNQTSCTVRQNLARLWSTLPRYPLSMIHQELQQLHCPRIVESDRRAAAALTRGPVLTEKNYWDHCRTARRWCWNRQDLRQAESIKFN